MIIIRLSIKIHSNNRILFPYTFSLNLPKCSHPNLPKPCSFSWLFGEVESSYWDIDSFRNSWSWRGMLITSVSEQWCEIPAEPEPVPAVQPLCQCLSNLKSKGVLLGEAWPPRRFMEKKLNGIKESSKTSFFLSGSESCLQPPLMDWWGCWADGLVLSVGFVYCKHLPSPLWAFRYLKLRFTHFPSCSQTCKSACKMLSSAWWKW